MSAVGIYYYFRGIIASYFNQGDIEKIEIPTIFRIALWITTIGTLYLGLYPTIVKNIF
jgi:NADH-quinone oxidoreductase subunit N